jgi:hypothetical protein
MVGDRLSEPLHGFLDRNVCQKESSDAVFFETEFDVHAFLLETLKIKLLLFLMTVSFGNECPSDFFLDAFYEECCM